ncbi:hypothetical protein [Sphingomonas elodea]|uniref:hypothetical protein n=1 Tax=Sphingomonas elodea TaxID=179878 RepID=UPI0013897F26|nr:hypothetical protein [Sphingomonas elodea]
MKNTIITIAADAQISRNDSASFLGIFIDAIISGLSDTCVRAPMCWFRSRRALPPNQLPNGQEDFGSCAVRIDRRRTGRRKAPSCITASTGLQSNEHAHSQTHSRSVVDRIIGTIPYRAVTARRNSPPEKHLGFRGINTPFTKSQKRPAKSPCTGAKAVDEGRVAFVEKMRRQLAKLSSSHR